MGPGATLVHRRADERDERPAYDDSDDEGRRDVKRRPRGSERSVSRDEAISLRELRWATRNEATVVVVKAGLPLLRRSRGLRLWVSPKAGRPLRRLAAVNAGVASGARTV